MCVLGETNGVDSLEFHESDSSGAFDGIDGYFGDIAGTDHIGLSPPHVGTC